MDCTTCNDRILDYLYDEMDADVRADFEASLAACPACAEELAAFRAILQAMDGAPSFELLPSQIAALETAAAHAQNVGDNNSRTGGAPEKNDSRTDGAPEKNNSRTGGAPEKNNSRTVGAPVTPLFQRPWFGVAIAATLTAAIGTWLVMSSTSLTTVQGDDVAASSSEGSYDIALMHTESAPLEDTVQGDDNALHAEEAQAASAYHAEAPAPPHERAMIDEHAAADKPPRATRAVEAPSVDAIARVDHHAEERPVIAMARADRGVQRTETSMERSVDNATASSGGEAAMEARSMRAAPAPLAAPAPAGAPTQAMAAAEAAEPEDDRAAAPVDAAAVSRFDAATTAWSRSSYREASRLYEAALDTSLSVTERELATFRSAVAAEKSDQHALAMSRYERYVRAYPSGRYAAEAHAAIKRLTP